MAQVDLEKCFDTKQAAKVLRRHEGTLRQWRIQGRGPKFIKTITGCVYYTADELEKFKQKYFSEYSSTAEAKQPRRT